MSDVIVENSAPPVESGAPLPKPDVPSTLTEAKQSEATKIASRWKQLKETAVSGDEKGIRSITRKREDNAPAVVDSRRMLIPRRGR
jgi:hypothetical protein